MRIYCLRGTCTLYLHMGGGERLMGGYYDNNMGAKLNFLTQTYSNLRTKLKSHKVFDVVEDSLAFFNRRPF